MSIRPRGRRGVPLRAPSERLKARGKITVKQEKFIRKLIDLLAHVVNEDGTFGVEDDKPDKITGKPGPTPDVYGEFAEEKENIKKATEWNLLQLPPGQKLDEINRLDVTSEGKNFIKFVELCKRHNELTNQMRVSLTALGGGHASEALKTMDDKIKEIRDIVSLEDGYVELKTDSYVRALLRASEAPTDLMEAFRKLRFFDTSVFDSLEKLKEQMKISATKIQLEYVYEAVVDEYLDFVTGPLASSFEIYIQELEIVEKASVSQVQEFSSQRYLNLTTIATFLSSVTATTLQTTATDDASPLRTTTNTLWFISLVFSTASAVYSLLITTWRQSSVQQKGLSLSTLSDAWLRNGPMYSLIAALSSFSIGLCLFAFLVVEKQGGLASAAVPIGFAGFHASAILLLSGCIIFAQSKDRARQQWMKVKDAYLPFIEYSKRTVESIRASIPKIGRRLKTIYSSFSARLVRSMNLGQVPVGDPELGQGDNSALPTEEVVQQPSGEDSDPAPADDTVPLQPENEQATPENVPGPGNELGGPAVASEDKVKQKPLVELLQFSLSGHYLASATSDTVTIYEANDNFDILRTCKVPGGDTIEQISMHYRNDILVRSSRKVCVWHSFDEESRDEPSAKLRQVVGSVRWMNMVDSSQGFICPVDKTIKTYELRSQDICKLREIESILDVEVFRLKHILCLVTTPGKETRLLVFRPGAESTECDIPLEFGHTSIVTSLTRRSDNVLLYGSEAGVEVVEFSSVDEDRLSVLKTYKLRDSINKDHGPNVPEAVVHAAWYLASIIAYSAGEVISLHRKPDDDLLSALHIFSTLDVDAIVENPALFAVSPLWYPYKIAFRDENGLVKVWSIQSNTDLAGCKRAKDFVIRDQRKGHGGATTITKGRYLILPPPKVDEPADV